MRNYHLKATATTVITRTFGIPRWPDVRLSHGGVTAVFSEIQRMWLVEPRTFCRASNRLALLVVAFDGPQSSDPRRLGSQNQEHLRLREMPCPRT